MATIEVRGYRYYLVEPYLDASKENQYILLESLLAACINYFNMALDLEDCQLPEADVERGRLVTLIGHFYRGVQHLHIHITSFSSSIDQETDAILDAILERKTALGAVLELLGEKQGPPWHSHDSDAHRIPNAQAFELLVSCVLKTLAANASLGGLKTRMMASRVVLSQIEKGSLVPRVRRDTGLPKIVFVCMKHKLVACSADQWGDLKRLNTEFRAFRFQRFDANPNEREVLVRRQKSASERLQLVTDWFNSGVTDFKARSKRRMLDKHEYNQLVSCMYATRSYGPAEDGTKEGGRPLGPKFGYDHLRESGRPFHASGEDLFKETARCWKCRFLFQYDIPRPSRPNNTGLSPEEPTQTPFLWYQELKCAEDLGHFRCWVASGKPKITDCTNLDFLPYPSLQT